MHPCPDGPEGMPRIRLTMMLAAAAVLLTTTGDRLAPGHGPDGVHAVRSGAPAGLPVFALFGWVSPPADFADSARYAEMAAAGLNLALPAFDDSGGLAPPGAQLDLAEANGLRVILWDPRFEKLADPGYDPDSLLDRIVADYRDHPGLAGYYLGDEPQPSLLPLLARVHAGLRARDPAHPGWNNLFGRQAYGSADALEAALRAYADSVAPAVLSDDHYDFTESGDRGHFIENVTRLAAVARAHGIPFWCVVQLTQHAIFRALTPGELRWQVSHLLAYGARGVGYFTYWTPAADPYWNWQPAVIDTDGTRTSWFDVLAAFNPYVRAAGERLAALAWITTQHAGSVPAGGQAFAPDDWVSAVEGRAAIGEFADAQGGRRVVVANSDSASAQQIALTFPGADSVAWLLPPGTSWSAAPAGVVPGGLRVTMTIEAGSFRLLRIFGADGGSGASGTRPGLDLSPNPARGACRMAVAAAVGGATLEIIDAGGRRIWARALAPGRSVVEWHGETDGGGRAPGGLYFARIRDERGTAVRRLAWLGAN